MLESVPNTSSIMVVIVAPAFLRARRSVDAAGICDEEIGACFCNGTFGRIPAPEGSPPGTPAIQQGRPMIEHCMPKYVRPSLRCPHCSEFCLQLILKGAMACAVLWLEVNWRVA